jgi:hypothetical protein
MLRPTIGAANRENVAELPEIKLSSPDAYGVGADSMLARQRPARSSRDQVTNRWFLYKSGVTCIEIGIFYTRRRTTGTL